jgi:preprotein translocase subunit SecG
MIGIDKVEASLTTNSLVSLRKSFLDYYMHTNSAYVEFDRENKRPHKWWHHRRSKIAFISLVVLIIFTITISLLLKFVILAPRKSDKITTMSTAISSSLYPTSTSTSALTKTTPTTSTITTTTSTLSTTTTTQQSGGFQRHMASRHAVIILQPIPYNWFAFHISLELAELYTRNIIVNIGVYSVVETFGKIKSENKSFEKKK